jgi:hypothetical protein
MFLNGLYSETTSICLLKSLQEYEEYPLFPLLTTNNKQFRIRYSLDQEKSKELAIVHKTIQFIFIFCFVFVVGSATTPVITFPITEALCKSTAVVQ